MRIDRVLGLAAAGCLAAGVAQAQISDDVVKIGVLTDMSSLYSDLAGPGSIIAAKMAVADFGGKVAGKPIEIISADHLNKPDVGSNIARQWIDQDHVDAIVDVPTSSVALAVQDVTKEKGKIFLMSGAGVVRPHRQGVLADRRALDLRHLCAGARHRRRARQAGRRQLVLHHRRLRLRPGARARYHERCDEGAAARSSAASACRSTAPISPPSCSRRRPPRPRSSASPMPAATPSTRSSRRRSSASSRAASSLAGLLVFISDVNSLGLQTAQGLVLTSAFYWDQNDETRAWSKRFMAESEEGADHGAGRRLRRGDALPQGDRGGEDRRSPRRSWRRCARCRSTIS